MLRAENENTALSAELYFYSNVFAGEAHTNVYKSLQHKYSLATDNHSYCIFEQSRKDIIRGVFIAVYKLISLALTIAPPEMFCSSVCVLPHFCCGHGFHFLMISGTC